MDIARGTVDDRTGADNRATPRSESVDYVRLGMPALFSAYAAGEERALALFGGDPYASADRRAAANRTASHPRDRGTLADILLDQNSGWGAPQEGAMEGVLAGIDALRNPESVAVVTGQQLGLFGGPLFTLYKALTAVRWVRRCAEETGRPAVPVFWLADEDHDFAEVCWAAFAAGERVARVTYDDGLSPESNRGAVGRLVLGDSIKRTLDEFEGGLPDGAFAGQLIAALRTAWQPGARWRDAFARTLRLLLPNAPIVFISGDDARIKALASLVLRAECVDWPATHAAHVAGTQAVTSAGFPVQVEPKPLHLFLLEDGRRLALDPRDAGAGIDVRTTGGRLAAGELQALAENEPERLSPDVVLRPVVQDALLPTAAYVAGPGETAYFAQLGPVYRRFDVPMPLVAPRGSLTLVEPAIRRALDRLGYDVPDVRADRTELLTRLAMASEAPSLDGALAGAERAAEAAVLDAGAAVRSVDTSLESAAAAALARTRHALQNLRRKAERVARRRHADDAARIERVRAALFPDGALQERALSALGLYARYGPHLEGLIECAVDPDARGHAIIDLP